VGGVQSQTMTVDRQLKRYDVPRLAFVNKSDRTGANPYKVKDQLIEKLGLNAVMAQIPIGLEEKHEGVVDLVTMKAYYFEGEGGLEMVTKEIPAELMAEAEAKREELIDAASMFSDELAEAFLEGDEIPVELLQSAIRKGVIAQELTPVFLGSAYKNKGVQPLLDGVISYLPNPTDVDNFAVDLEKDEEEVKVKVSNDEPTIALAFKLEDGQYGQLTYVRIYQGKLEKGSDLLNVRTRKKFKVGRLVRMHSNHMEDIEGAGVGDIVALFGIDCASGDTFCDPNLNVSMTSMFVPDAVISLSITPKDNKASNNLAKALNRFTKEDPTFRTHVDPESNRPSSKGWENFTSRFTSSG
jgi:elongation factor G